ncbi:MAG: hypothetical protein ABGW87_10340 [Sphingomonadaceae bacterium]
MRRFSALILASMLAGCVSAPSRGPARPTTPSHRPPPMRPTVPPPAKQGFIAPTVMHRAGLEDVIGRDASALQRVFGKARLDVKEGDAVKLQFAGPQCVLDVYLYPLRPGAEPTATDVEARRASDGLDVDRAACVAALRR